MIVRQCAGINVIHNGPHLASQIMCLIHVIRRPGLIHIPVIVAHPVPCRCHNIHALGLCHVGGQRRVALYSPYIMEGHIYFSVHRYMREFRFCIIRSQCLLFRLNVLEPPVLHIADDRVRALYLRPVLHLLQNRNLCSLFQLFLHRALNPPRGTDLRLSGDRCHRLCAAFRVNLQSIWILKCSHGKIGILFYKIQRQVNNSVHISCRYVGIRLRAPVIRQHLLAPDHRLQLGRRQTIQNHACRIGGILHPVIKPVVQSGLYIVQRHIIHAIYALCMDFG